MFDIPGAIDKLQSFFRLHPEADTDLRADGLENVLTGMGVDGKDHRKANYYTRGRQIQRIEYEALFENSFIFAAAVDTLPENCTRNWVSLTANDQEDDFSKKVLKAAAKLKAKARFFELLHASRLHGGAAMIAGVNDGQSPDKPLNFATIKSVDFLSVLNRHEIFPQNISQNPMSPNFREPEFWTFSPGVDSNIVGMERIHNSRVFAMRGIAGEHRTLATNSGASTNMSTLYWGVNLAQRVKDAIFQYESLLSSIEAGFKDISQGHYGISGLSAILASEKGHENLMKRLRLIVLMASAFNYTVHDKDTETLEKNPPTFAGLDSIVMRFAENLGAATGIPLTKLFGWAPSGMSTDDASAEKTWNARVSSEQATKLLEPLTLFFRMLLCATDGPTNGVEPDEWEVVFNPLDEPSESQIAGTRKMEADTDAVLIQSGIINEVEARSRLWNDATNPYALDESFDEEIANQGEMAREAMHMHNEQLLQQASMPPAAQASEATSTPPPGNGA